MNTPLTVVPTVLTVFDELNLFSQSGEDGIITKILDVLNLGRRGGTVVDIGAADGVFLSNTAALREKGWRTCLIEANESAYMQCARIRNVTAIHAKVTPDNVDLLLSVRFPIAISEGCDVMSIDIDGDDIWVFETMMLRPKVVVIEYNPTFPPFVIRANPRGTCKGSSLGAIVEVAKAKRYDLVYATISNAIFVDTEVNRERLHVWDAFGAFRWDQCKFVTSDFDGQNGFAYIHGVVDEISNPWDAIPSATLHTYPSDMLGFNNIEMMGLRRHHVKGD